MRLTSCTALSRWVETLSAERVRGGIRETSRDPSREPWPGVVVSTAPSAESTVWLKGSAAPVWRPNTARESPAQAVATLQGQ